MICRFGGLIAALAALVVVWFAAPAPAATAAATPDRSELACTYDSGYNPVMSTDLATKRGPPRAHAHAILSNMIDDSSIGVSSSPDTTTTTPAVCAYDHAGLLAQATRPMVTTEAKFARADGDSFGAQRAGVAAKGAIDIRPPLSIGSKQFGTKWGKHAADYGLDPANSSSRTWFMNRARDVHLNPTEVRRGAWNPSGGGGENYFFFRQGDDLLITRPGGEFVTMFPGGSTNAWFKNAGVFPH